MKCKFELIPTIGIHPIKLGESRASIADLMNATPNSFMKTPMSKHPTDAFFDSGFQIFYDGDNPIVDSIELSRGCGFEVMLSGVSVFEIPVEEVLVKVKEVTGIKPITEDDGYSYEIPKLGLWFWRPDNECDEEEGMYFSTVGIGTTNT